MTRGVGSGWEVIGFFENFYCEKKMKLMKVVVQYLTET